MMFCWVIGKMNIKRKERKVSRSMLVRPRQRLKGILRPLTRWLVRLKMKKSVMLAETLEFAITNTVMFNMMAAWRTNVTPTQLVNVQRELKLAILRRRATYTNLMIKWDKTELEIGKRLKKQGVKALELGVFNIPTEVKLFCLRCRIKDTVKRHKVATTAYVLQCRVAEKERKAQHLNLIQDAEMIELEAPSKPVISLNFNSRVIKELILKAQSLRLHWDRITTELDNASLEREFGNVVNEDAYSTPGPPSRLSKHKRTESAEPEETKKKRSSKLMKGGRA
jgi:hypothetical protein